MNHAAPLLQSPSSTLALFRRRLLAWFQRDQRDLPWRHNRNPYHVWVSEVMLQQTQVATVIPYYQRFLKAFPTIRALADASEQEVFREWEGLGYYRRARDLHQAAKQVMNNHGGKVPCEPEAFRALPGIGRYMAGAVLSQAFEKRLPILEANSLRVLCRLTACREDPRKGEAHRRLWTLAERLLPTRRIGDFNQALMELGALVCTSRNPDCSACPAARFCVAHQRGWQEQIPAAKSQPKIISQNAVAVVIRRRDQVLLVQRPSKGRWADFWEFPNGPVLFSESPSSAARRITHELTNLNAKIGTELTAFKYRFTRYQIKLSCFSAEYEGGRFRSAFYPRGKWVKPEDLGDYPLSAANRRLAKSLMKCRIPHDE